MDDWDERCEAYRESPTHREGDDLDLLVEWCEPAPGVEVLDVATGGGHVARRLRELGCEVTTLDATASMVPDVLGVAEDLPFEDRAFEVVTCRIAAHHFLDVGRAVKEMARVSRRYVVVEDTLWTSADVELAETLRDPSHVRSLTEAQWKLVFWKAGLRVDQMRVVEKHHDLEAWLARTGCFGEVAERVRELLAPWTENGVYRDEKLLMRGFPERAEALAE